MSRLVRVGGCAAVALAVVLALLAARPPARPRIDLISSNPADRATLARAPVQIELGFTAAVDPHLSHLSVLDGSGAALTVGRPHLVEPERLRQRVHIAAAGEVTIAYHVTSVDGAERAGVLRFTARTGAAAAPGGPGRPSATPAPHATAEATHRHGVDPVSAALLVLDGLVALGVIVLLMVRPRPRARSVP